MSLSYLNRAHCVAHYKEDLNESSLRAQMTMFQKMFPDNDTLCYTDVIDIFKKLEPGKRKLLSEVCKVFELILVLQEAFQN